MYAYGSYPTQNGVGSELLLYRKQYRMTKEKVWNKVRKNM